MANFKKFVLPNGLRVILVPQKQSLTTTVMVSVKAGSEYENKNNNGISHFLEHMCFKGTVKRPKAINISEELDGLGANYNAFTSQESTSYYAKVKNDNILKVLEIVTDMYLNPIFDSSEIEKERGVIIQELNMYEDLPQRKVHELFFNLVYGDQPAGWDIGGKKEIIQKLKREDFVTYREKYYLPNTTVVTISGGGVNEKTLNLVKKYFAHLKKGKKINKVKTIENQTKPQALAKFKKVDQTHLVLGLRAFNIFNPQKYALYLAANILGGSMSSRLFQKIREELGAAYYVHADTDLYLDHGLLTVSAGVAHEKVEVVIQKILEEFVNLAQNEVSQKELEKAKEHWIGNFFMALESSDAWASYYSGQEILGLPIQDPKEIAKLIQKVTSKDILQVMKQIVKNKRLNLALIGPFQKKNFADILRLK
jgi:predicted Zn-dependent peptidase